LALNVTGGGVDMKISKLIECLQIEQNSHGDKELILVNMSSEEEGHMYMDFKIADRDTNVGVIECLDADLMNLSDEIEIYITEE